MLMGGAVGLPIPEDLPLILAGIVIQSGNAPFAVVFFVCYSAIILGDLIVFSIGRKFGPRLFAQPWFRKLLSRRNISNIRLGLERRSLLMIFIARHLFYMRTVTFLTCGAVKMRLARFMIADAVAALVSVPVMISVGYFAAEHYETVMQRTREVALIAPIVLLAIYLMYRKLKKEKAATLSPSSVQLGANAQPTELVSDKKESLEESA